jgi:hypothetical protein
MFLENKFPGIPCTVGDDVELVARTIITGISIFAISKAHFLKPFFSKIFLSRSGRETGGFSQLRLWSESHCVLRIKVLRATAQAPEFRRRRFA